MMIQIEKLLPFLNKYVLSIMVAVAFYALNVYELIGEASNPQMDPFSAVYAGLLCFLAIYVSEWALKRQGILLSTKIVPDITSSTTPDMFRAELTSQLAAESAGSAVQQLPILDATSW